MTRPTLRVIKVGGSLWQCEDLAQRLTGWLAKTGNGPPDCRAGVSRIDILVAGGGALVDQVRQLDARFSLGAETAHWMSVGAMSCTAGMLARLADAGHPVRRWLDLDSILSNDGSRVVVFDVRQWLADLEADQPGVHLTLDWRTTSDSIAARLAHVIRADELVLLKSTGNAHGTDWHAAAEHKLVDEHFPQVAVEAPRIRWVNLLQFNGPATTCRQFSTDAS